MGDFDTGTHLDSPGPIGGTTPAAGVFTALKATTGAAAGNIPISDADGDLGYLAAGATTKILVGGGAANPVWTEATGSGAPVRASSPTLSGTPLTSAPADNTATTQIATTAFAKSENAVLMRPPSQGVNMIAVTSGSTGIAIADNDNLDAGTGNFSDVVKVTLPDYTPAAIVVLSQKTDGTNGWNFQVLTTGYLRLTINTTNYDSTATLTSVGVIDGYSTKLGYSVTRESASVAGSVVFYVNGVALGSSVAITAGTPTTVVNAATMYLMGTSATRTAGTVFFHAFFNRVLSATEHLNLYRNGINFADKWGSQTAKQSDTLWTGATGATPPTGWLPATAGLFAIVDSGDGAPFDAALRITVNTVPNPYPAIYKVYTSIIGRRYRVEGYLKNGTAISSIFKVGSTVVGLDYANNVCTVTTWTKYSVEFIATTTIISIVLAAGGSSAGQTAYFDEITITAIGATIALEPEGIQSDPGQWFDSSSNKLHAMQPAAGSSLIRKKDTFEIRWTNTWAGTQEAQYIGGVNQAVLPVGCYITDIIGVITGGTIEDIIVGDGSDTDRWVAITTGLATGTTAFTIANRISDGTNYKLVVDPDANFTGSIAWTIRGIILQ